MIQCVLTDFERPSSRLRLPAPFLTEAPGFFPYLRTERGLREGKVHRYLHYLRRFERYLAGIGRSNLRSLSPQLLRDFVEQRSRTWSSRSVAAACDVLRGFPVRLPGADPGPRPEPGGRAPALVSSGPGSTLDPVV